MNVGELIGEIGYTMTFALGESLLLAFPLVIIGIFLSRKWREKHLVPVATIAILLLALAALLLQFFEKLWNFEKLIAGVWLGATISLGLLSVRFEGFGRQIDLTLERMMVLIYFYLAIDFLGLFVVLVRNL